MTKRHFSLLCSELSNFDNGRVSLPLRIDGQQIATMIEENVSREVKRLQTTHSLTPRLLIFVGAEARDDTLVYVNKKRAACQRVGIHCDVESVPLHFTTRQWIDLIKGRQSAYDAIIVQWPINASHVTWTEVVESIDPLRDVDCLTLVNHGKLALGIGIDEDSTTVVNNDNTIIQQHPSVMFLPVKECLEWTYTQLRSHQIPHRSLSQSNIVLLGRSLLVGRPMASYLLSVRLLLCSHIPFTYSHSFILSFSQSLNLSFPSLTLILSLTLSLSHSYFGSLLRETNELIKTI
jgi:5,10-methylene-tetrahydrofolate dehydrogenase/methenyl tetrahydrofolate cyclohydrolase